MAQAIKKKKKIKKSKSYFDYNLIAIIIFLICIGLVMLYSISSYTAAVEYGGNDMYYFTKQLIFSVAGFIIMLVVAKIPYKIYAFLAPYLFMFSIILCLLVQTSLGITRGGATRWLPMPVIGQFQPSEAVKLAIVLFVPLLICKKGIRVGKNWYWLRIMAVVGTSFVGVWYFTENLSTAIIVCGIGIGIFLIALPMGRNIMLAGCALVPAIYIALQWWVSSLPEGVTADDIGFRPMRVVAWLRPESNADTTAYQTLQGLYAIGSGGFWGKGLGNGTQKLSAIPEVQNDMILSAICEEIGIFGALLIMILFLMLIYRLMVIAQNAPDMYSALVVSGIFIHIALQVIFNIGVITATIPNTGVTLPFFSYGGTAIFFMMAEMGIALGISNRIRYVEEEELSDNHFTEV